MAFDPNVALEYARALARPRRVGSAEERAVVDEIAGRLENLGYQVERQWFEFSTAPYITTTLVILAGQLLILITFWAWEIAGWLSAVTAVSILALLATGSRLIRAVTAGSIAPDPGVSRTAWGRLCLRLGRRYHTANVVAGLPVRASAVRPDAPRLYLAAHSDSKSQALPLAARMALVAVAGSGGAAFAILTLLALALPGLTPAAAVIGLVALLAGTAVLLLFLVGVGNASPGANDNASGIGLVLHLAEVLSHQPPRLPVTLLITGAEEFGLMGATAYVLQAARTGLWRLPGRSGDIYVLNFDGVGIAGRLALVSANRSQRLAGLVRAACGQMQLPLGRLPRVGALFDHMPFADRGCDAVSLVILGPATRTIHSAADSADRLDPDGFRQAGQVALCVIRALEKE